LAVLNQIDSFIGNSHLGVPGEKDKVRLIDGLDDTAAPERNIGQGSSDILRTIAGLTRMQQQGKREKRSQQTPVHSL
jgi:hypothetical protein